MQGYKDIGDMLARAREERRMTVADVAAALHIRPRYIEALEQGNLDVMPSLTYVKGYLKRYAGYLSLDLIEVLRRFELATQQDSSAFFIPHSFSHEKRVDSKTVATATLAAGFLLLMWAIWLRPAQDALPVVEMAPEKLMAMEPAEIVAEKQQVPCLREQKSVYPPCIWVRPEPTRSIMYAIRP